MPRELPRPITYLITAGKTADAARADPFGETLALVRLAVSHGVTLVQLREKHLGARPLYELAVQSAAITRGTNTRLLINDRADVARAAGCDGVHLAASSLEAAVVRRAFGDEFLIGVSAHSLDEARAAREGGADFAVFGPVFDTPSKRTYGPPVGLGALKEAARELSPFPLVALGGVGEEQVEAVLRAGAAGVAGIRLFADGQNLARIVHHIGRAYGPGERDE